LLSIPRFGIEAPVAKSGLLPDGEMEAPADAQTVSWYKYGYLPGSVGNAVFAGHNTFNNISGAFSNLYSLQAGDKIIVTNSEHNRLTFTVSQVHQYDAAAAPVIDIFGPAKKAQIRLITCAGEWNNMKKMFGDRIIVTAEFSGESAQ
jgi:LPXTG-site transpeptidase (sortase) family protein